MNKLKRLAYAMNRLEKNHVKFDSRLRFISQFIALDDWHPVIECLEDLRMKPYTIVDYKNENSVPSIMDVQQFSKSIQISNKLRYAITYRIVCSSCEERSYVTSNCVSHLIPKLCDVCRDKLQDQGS